MNHPWQADVDLSPARARRLIERQFPALAPARIAALGVGWDNTAYLVNREYVFRFPRREVAVGLLENEVRALPRLAPRLPLPVPVPQFVGAPDDGYPYPFAGYRHLPGVTACRVEWAEPDRAACAEPLGRFLRALHRIPVDEETRRWAPGDTLGRADMARRAPALVERLREVAPLLPAGSAERAVALVERLAAAPPHADPTCWVHGDLYARHLLVDEGHRLCGVIDWGDAHLGDPTLDLSIAFSFLPPDAREYFRHAYGPLDDAVAVWDRARFRALHYVAPLVTYGTETGDDAIRRAGEDALRLAIE